MIKTQLDRWLRQHLVGIMAALVMFMGLAGGLWFGLHEWNELRNPDPKPIVIKKKPRPKTPEEKAHSARKTTRRLIKSDRSNVDCKVMKCFALTYDDGPSAHTNKLLDTLKNRRAVATFFVLGIEAIKRPDVLKRTVKENSEIGNHTWSHARLTAIDNASMTSQILQTDQVIQDATGTTPRLVRPPYGSQDSRVAGIAIRPLAIWNIDPEDWKYRDPGHIYQHVISHARPGGIAVLHDIFPASVHASARIVDELQRQGYVLVTMSEMFGINDKNLPSFSRQVLKNL